MKEKALEYLHMGYSVMPVGKDKRPLVSWKEYQKEFPLEDQIERWWKQFPDAQVGIITGELSGLTVIDIEAGGDTTIFDHLDTYVVKTGGGGYHIYFDYEPTITNAVRTLPLTDIRSEGGYVVAAGSTTDKGSYTVVKEVAPMKMPEAIRVLFERKAAPFSPAFLPRTEQNVNEMPEYSGSGEGGRNDSLTRYTGRILATMAPMYWETVAWPLLLEANKKNNPPLPDAEVRLIFKSISEREGPRTGERRYGERRVQPTSQDSGPKTILSEDRPASAILTLEEAANSQTIDVDKTTATNIEIFDEALMGGFSPGDVIIIAGRSGVGKTTFAQDLTASFLTNGSSALWFSYEVMAMPLYRKFLEMNLPIEDMARLYVPMSPLPSVLPDIATITAFAAKEKESKLLVVDHIGFIDPQQDRNSNHALGVTQVVRGLKKIAIENEIAVILPVHVRKIDAGEPSLEDVRDSYGVVQEADVVFLIDRKRSATAAERAESYYSDNVRITLAKNRKTGISKSGIFSLVSGRYAYQPTLSAAAETDYEPRRSFKKEKAAVDKQWEKLTAGEEE